ncbi:sugar phosphate isomerase/epimerase family protein [Paenibacillus roseipurpureus]|uniref:Sugar phosphate isomerase/epimerase family protein n=1 Tax=Paenibacillus roseopurpureus TaxID=2918901 RepID=A0AA96LJR2_9BACL|nr:sugar phosphate isomerase/epimerase family protein [Paenibacillus sp. MBLB1832]WNR43020.1 sugar phosphate isomerase/epimerase family protein [Paenibacillus sp. MBLB1832]
MTQAEINELSLAQVYKQIPTKHYLEKQPRGEYYTGDYKLGVNLYSFSHNLFSWLKGGGPVPPADTLSLIRFCKEIGCDCVDITSYFIPGYENFTMPSKPDQEIYAYAESIRKLSEELGIEISGTGVKNDFADPDAERRALDVKRIKYWIDVAAAMGAPVMRVFNGEIPKDILTTDWETIAKERIVPALMECADYGASKGIRIGMQNHADITSTADQVIRILEWANHPNLGVVNDTGCYKTFGAKTGDGYAWYDDIEAVLPYTYNFQIKRLPAGLNTEALTELDELFTRIRYSNYRGYVPLETIWSNSDPLHPGKLSEPPYEQVRVFFDEIKEAMLRTMVQN